jgi:hypothetical protein
MDYPSTRYLGHSQVFKPIKKKKATVRLFRRLGTNLKILEGYFKAVAVRGAGH